MIGHGACATLLLAGAVLLGSALAIWRRFVSVVVVSATTTTAATDIVIVLTMIIIIVVMIIIVMLLLLTTPRLRRHRVRRCCGKRGALNGAMQPLSDAGAENRVAGRLDVLEDVQTASGIILFE